MGVPQANVATMSSSESPLPQKERLPHSKWGIVSFILPFIFAIAFIVYAIICDVLHNPDKCPDCLDDWCFHSLVIAVHVTFGFCVASAVPFILAIIGLCQPRTRKIFSILGLCLSALPVAFLIRYFLLFLLQ